MKKYFLLLNEYDMNDYIHKLIYSYINISMCLYKTIYYKNMNFYRLKPKLLNI